MSTCPRCHASLAPVEYEGITVEACSQCNGHWLRQPQLKDIVDTREKTWDREEVAAMQKPHLQGVPLEKVREALPCPACGRTMETFDYAGDTGILLDRCRDCGGLWLDGGELEKVQAAVEASDENLDAAAKRYSGTLREVEAREDLQQQKDNRRTLAPLFTQLADRFLAID